MEARTFRRMSEIEKKAILCGVITKRTAGKLDKTVITDIVNKLDMDIQYKVEVFTDAKEFAKAITLKWYTLQHSWAGNEGETEEWKQLYSSDRDWTGFSFGSDILEEYSNNGSIRVEEKVCTEPNFNIDTIYAIYVENHSWANWDNNSYDDYTHYIRIYIPTASPYVVAPELLALIENFNIE